MNNNFLSKYFGSNNNQQQQPSTLSNNQNDIFETYRKLEALFKNNGAYDNISRTAALSGVWLEAIKPLRTVVNRSVEFYVSKMLAGARVVTDKPALMDALEQFNTWSNFDSKRRGYSRGLSLYGDLFLKVTTDGSKVYRESINPTYVTDFSVDNRGILTEIRIDIPIDDGKTYTEYWSKNEQYMSIWKHQYGRYAELERLGTPKEFIYLSEMGIDFIPIVYVKFADFDERGFGCVTHALDKIDEANRMATRLHQLLFRFNKPVMAVMANGVDAQGRPLPAPKVNTKDTPANSKRTDAVQVTDNDVLYLPGYSKAEQLIPNVNYADALKILQDQMHEIELDLPELKSYSLDTTQLSGKAISLLLGAAIDRLKDARANLVQGLIRTDEIALTVGIFNGVFPATIGKYENGDFEHSIVCDELFGMSEDERAAILKSYMDAGLPLAFAMKRAGFTDEEIAQAVESKSQEQNTSNANLANALLSFNKA